MLQGHGPGPAAPECHRPAPRTSGGITQPIMVQPIMVHIHPIMIGVTGTIYKEFFLVGLSQGASMDRCPLTAKPPDHRRPA